MLLDQIRVNYNLPSKLSHHLLVLKNFEIFIVCDDSGSMTTRVDSTRNTRWDELCVIVKTILKIAILFDLNGVDINFLNRGVYSKIRNPSQVDQAFKKQPVGYTPLVPVLRKIFQHPKAQPGREKKLLVIVATDGKPTNDDGDEIVDELEDLMRHTRIAETTHVSFLLCTDEPKCVDYLRRWDQTMTNVDVTDDYTTESKRIRECQENENYEFTYSDYIIKALIGSIVPDVDYLNERRVETVSRM